MNAPGLKVSEQYLEYGLSKSQIFSRAREIASQLSPIDIKIAAWTVFTDKEMNYIVNLWDETVFLLPISQVSSNTYIQNCTTKITKMSWDNGGYIAWKDWLITVITSWAYAKTEYEMKVKKGDMLCILSFAQARDLKKAFGFEWITTLVARKSEVLSIRDAEIENAFVKTLLKKSEEESAKQKEAVKEIVDNAYSQRTPEEYSQWLLRNKIPAYSMSDWKKVSCYWENRVVCNMESWDFAIVENRDKLSIAWKMQEHKRWSWVYRAVTKWHVISKRNGQKKTGISFKWWDTIIMINEADFDRLPLLY